MNKAVHIVIVAIVCCASSVSAQVQLTKSSGFLRTTIETYPAGERQPILDYMDTARGVADRAAGQLASGHGEDLFREIEATVRSAGEQVDMQGANAQLERLYGSVTSYEYRAQALEAYGDKPDVHDLSHATSVVFYAVRTTKRPEGGLFLAIKTIRTGGEHKVFLINFNDYVGKPPPWLQPKPSTT